MMKLRKKKIYIYNFFKLIYVYLLYVFYVLIYIFNYYKIYIKYILYKIYKLLNIYNV